ncbi:MAG: V-type ATP synthase subunit F [Lachnospiraceae bacterium]|nr:V-type ATP synthase subunit F [Lachnospiraceae bacterium]
MVKIAVMGEYDDIYGFAALGLSTFPVDIRDPDSAGRILRNLAENDFGIIYITEELAALLTRDIDRYRTAVSPAIICIPGVKGNTGEGVRNVKRSVEQAVGSDILFGND